MFGRETRDVGFALAICMALMLVAPSVCAAGEGVQYPGIGEGNWQSLGSQPLEFDLAYAGNNEGAEIQLASDPSSRAGFAVYTDWAWKQLGAGNTGVTPVGMGTSNPDAGGNLTWKAQASPSELYHIQVYPIGTDHAMFWIKQQGSGNSVLWAVSPLPSQP
jgi:hypothetical protein